MIQINQWEQMPSFKMIADGGPASELLKPSAVELVLVSSSELWRMPRRRRGPVRRAVADAGPCLDLQQTDAACNALASHLCCSWPSNVHFLHGLLRTRDILLLLCVAGVWSKSDHGIRLYCAQCRPSIVCACTWAPAGQRSVGSLSPQHVLVIAGRFSCTALLVRAIDQAR